MKRDVYNNLLQWKKSKLRKPLIVRGARQVGKTYLLQEFGNNEYDRLVYCNFEENESLDDFFKYNLNPHNIIKNLSIYFGFEIRPEKDLIIFDEVQASNFALNSLKYFNEKANEFHIAAAGSLIGVLLSRPKSFPVGKVNFLEMHPMTFLEFLNAVDKKELRNLIESTQEFNPYPGIFHEELIQWLKKYLYVGGMPEAVKSFKDFADYEPVRTIQKEIINSYVLDFAKHAPTSDIPKLRVIWESIPAQLGKENKKFIFSAIRKSARSRDYEYAIQWLQDAGLIYISRQIKTARHPLKAYMNINCFKIFSLDVGILGAMANLLPGILIDGNKLFTEYKGALVENYVAQQLYTEKQIDLFYWTSKGNKAELDFLCEINNEIFPLEAKSGVNPKSKSLISFDKQFQPEILSRTSLLNLKKDKKVCNYPLYAISLFPI